MDISIILNLINNIPSDFWSQLFATLIGVIAGIPVAFWIQKKIDFERVVDEKKYLIDFLSKNLERNLDLLRKAKKELPSKVIFYNLDLGAWNFVSQKIGIIKDNILAEDISRIFYQLGHLSRKIDRQYEMHYSAFAAMSNYPVQRQDLVKATIIHIDLLEKDIKEILDRLNGVGKNE